MIRKVGLEFGFVSQIVDRPPLFVNMAEHSVTLFIHHHPLTSVANTLHSIIVRAPGYKHGPTHNIVYIYICLWCDSIYTRYFYDVILTTEKRQGLSLYQ